MGPGEFRYNTPPRDGPKVRAHHPSKQRILAAPKRTWRRVRGTSAKLCLGERFRANPANAWFPHSQAGAIGPQPRCSPGVRAHLDGTSPARCFQKCERRAGCSASTQIKSVAPTPVRVRSSANKLRHRAFSDDALCVMRPFVWLSKSIAGVIRGNRWCEGTIAQQCRNAPCTIAKDHVSILCTPS